MSNRIRELRAGAGLSQQELALRVGVRRETIVFLEKGKYNPSLRLAHDIAKVFGLPIEEVFRFDDGAGR
ncbi:MAG TPA: helix-turn-helix transcriptional regulator [Candidatus Aminicenantes bacterium]|nr:helix-turn-helix transcriptional regulator [Candidatus Aminicenantes bacterium]